MILLSRLPLRLRRTILRLLRWRHRCGYGIHSPFAFAKVTGVIYERGTYYAYAPLQSAYPCPPRDMTHGDLRLLLRLSNETHPRRGWIIDRSGTDAPGDYLKAGCTSCRWMSFTADAPPSSTDATTDFAYIDTREHPTEWMDAALSHLTDGGAIIVRGIYRTEAARGAWQWLKEQDRVRVTFDLYDFGIAYVERRLNKENYIVSYH